MNGSRRSKRILFAGGGTAGHLMPAINIAREITGRDKTIESLFVGKKDGMEKGIAGKFGFDIKEIDFIGMRRSFGGVLRFAMKWHKGHREADSIVKSFGPDAMVGTGGYISAPVVKAAYKRKIPVFLQEQNSLPGLASRSLGRYADIIFTAYDSAGNYFDRDKCRLVGNPVRSDLMNADKDKSYVNLGFDSRKNTLLVLGGSSGARGVNLAIISLIENDGIPGDWQVIWQTGQNDYDLAKSKISSHDFKGSVLRFIDDMPSAYAIADLIVSRAGAMALAEITVMGIPSILIPYPHATGDHQTANARYLEKEEAAVLIRESDIKEQFIKEITELFRNKDKRAKMAENSRSLGKPEAAGIIASTILERIGEIQED